MHDATQEGVQTTTTTTEPEQDWLTVCAQYHAAESAVRAFADKHLDELPIGAANWLRRVREETMVVLRHRSQQWGDKRRADGHEVSAYFEQPCCEHEARARQELDRLRLELAEARRRWWHRLGIRSS